MSVATPTSSPRVVLVTGGSRGIGAAIAAAFAALGDTVVVCGRTAPDPADGGSGEFVTCDVRDAGQVATLIDGIVARYGRLDVVMNNAGGAPNADSATVSPRFVTRIVELNLLAPFFVTQSANRVMQEQDSGGVVINIGSIAARNPAPHSAAYAAAKGGLTTLTRAMALDFGPKVRVNQVTVGLVETELADEFYGGPQTRQRIAAAIPLGRMATGADVADACLALAGPLTAYVTGAELLVDGGGEIPTRHVLVAESSNER